MKRKTQKLGLVLAAGLMGQMALAQSATDQIVTDLQSQGFTAIEIKTGPTQIKVEAIRGGQKIEVIYDAATGQILKQEVESSAGENISPGVSIDQRDEDFLDDDDRDEDDDDDDDDDDDEDDDD